MELIAFIIVSVVFTLVLIGFLGRCEACGSLSHAYSPGHLAERETGKAYLVCKRCGHKVHKGQVSQDGSVMWANGGAGTFKEDGSYSGDCGSFVDGGGDGGGGGGE